VAGDVPAVHGLRRPGRHKLFLAFYCPQSFFNPERHTAFRRAPHHANQVRMHPGQA
jgi:hypothetical protein